MDEPEPTRKDPLLDRIREYVEALQNGDLGRMLALFTPDATVTSPLAGTQQASTFYRDLFAVSRSSKVRILQEFSHLEQGTAAALLEYDWTLENGAQKMFECMDLFTFDKHSRIRELKIFYNPGEIASDYETIRASAPGKTSDA